MNKVDFDKFETLKKGVSPFKIVASDFTFNYIPRTLLYGYTSDRKSWHVYMDTDYLVRRYVYEHGKEDQGDLLSSFSALSDLVPDKRLYPECCDFAFCLYLCKKSIYLPFSKFDERNEFKTYYGVVPNLAEFNKG